MTRLLSRSTLSLLLLAAALFGGARSLRAHVKLDNPNGGERLQIGSVFTIRWHIQINHNLQNWDLWYSTTGANGPWIPIVMDLPASARSYQWNVQTVPAKFSSRVRVRVRMDNSGQDYEDISDGDLTIVPSLTATTQTVSLSKGGVQVLNVDGGKANAGQLYLVLGSFGGTSPGLNFGPFTLPLKVDFYFIHTLGLPNSIPLSGSLGFLDASGKASAKFTMPPGILPPSFSGITVNHAAVVFGKTSTFTLMSNAVPVKLVK